MGINIHVYEIIDNIKNIYNSFDTFRYRGDSDFIYKSNFKWISLLFDDYSFDFYQRPKNINEARNWIEVNIVEENKKRLLKLMDDMEKNENLWICVSC